MSQNGITPNFDALLAQAWGWPNSDGLPWWGAGYSNIVIGTNPPYTVTDFLSFYPKFGGTPLQVVNCTTVANSAVVQLANPVPGLAVGQLVTGPGVAGGAAVASYTQGTNEVTLSLPLTASASSVTLNFYPSPFVPMAVLNAYIALASAHLVQARWLDTWVIAMGLFTAHFCTLYLRSEAGPFPTAGAAAVAGLQKGITVSKGAGSVSQGIQPYTGMEQWAAWTATEYGAQLATLAAGFGSGPMLVL